jgi:biotin operon repressor
MTRDNRRRLPKEANEKPRPFLWAMWDHTATLTSAQVLVLAVLESYRGKRGIFPSQQKVAKRSRLGRSTVNKAIKELRRNGFVTTSGRGKALRYTLSIPGEAVPGTCSIETQQVCSKERAGVQQANRDQKEPREQTERNEPNETGTHEIARSTRAAIARLPMLRNANEQMASSRNAGIRQLAIDAGLSSREAANAELRLAAILVEHLTPQAAADLRREVEAKLAAARTPAEARAAFRVAWTRALDMQRLLRCF